jgi:hypothetical protein
MRFLLAVAATSAAPAHAITIFEAPRERRCGDAVLRATTLDEIRDLDAGRLRVDDVVGLRQGHAFVR